MGSYNRKANVAALGIATFEDRIYFSAVDKNGLYSIDKGLKDVKFLQYFDDEELSQDVLHGDVKECNGELIFSPHRAKKIAVYKIKNNTMVYYDVPECVTNLLNEAYDSQVKFNNIITIKNAAYILGYSYPGIVKYQDGQCTVLNEWVHLLNDKIPKDDIRGYISEGYVVRSNHIYLPVGCLSCVLDINIDTDDIQVKEVPSHFDGIGGIASLPDGRIVLVGRGKNANKIVFWNVDENSCSELVVDEELEKCDIPFYNPIVHENSIFLFPLLNCKNIYRIHLETLSIDRISLETDFNEQKNNVMYPWVTMGIYVENNEVVFSTGFDLKWHKLNLCSSHIEDYEISHEESCKYYYEYILKKKLSNNEIVTENEVPLERFINFL